MDRPLDKCLPHESNHRLGENWGLPGIKKPKTKPKKTTPKKAYLSKYMSTIFFQTTGVIVKTLGERKCFLFIDTLNTFYGLMASNMWLRVPVREITHCCHFMGSNTPLNRQINIYTMAFVTLIMKYWLE